MPSILPGVLNASFYEDIRDRIAEILVLEIPAQGALLSDPDITGIDKVYIERSVEFSADQLPAVNVITEKVDFGDETTIGKQFTAEYAVDVYGKANTTATNRADETSNKFVQKLAALVDGILSYDGYARLDFPAPNATNPRGVSNRKVYDIQLFNPESSKNAEMIVRARVRIRVKGNQPKLVVEPRPLDGTDAQFVLYNSNEAYFYSSDSTPPSILDPCDPVIIQNSDSSWEVTQFSGTTAVLPDSDISVNGGTVGSVVSVKDIDLSIFDSDGPVTPGYVGVVDNVIEIEISTCADGSVTLDGAPLATVPSGGTFDAELVDQFGATITPTSIVDGVITVDQTGTSSIGLPLMKTGQTTSYVTDDDGSDPQGRDVDFFTLSANNPFGNTNRFTDTVGGQAYTNSIVIDWSTYDSATGDVLACQTDLFLTGYTSLASAITHCQGLTIDGFSDWRQGNFNEVLNFAIGKLPAFDYAPFNSTAPNILWTSTTLSATTCINFRLDTYQTNTPNPTANSGRPFPVRTFNWNGTNLT